MSENLKNVIMDQVKQAMRAKDSKRLGTLRMLQAALKQKEVDERKDLSNDEIIAIIEKQIKQRKESAKAFKEAGRDDAAQAEEDEIKVLEPFLPEQLSQEDVLAAVQKVVADLQAQGLSGGAAMGKAMGQLKTQLAGKADMSNVSALLKEQLNKQG
ncbi:GatB/YqeY domain-containing protein [Brackiella oedipodis]|uniref:GatB/YqeY domain-containing protein n=1 Tax=Brackiella oedipodis TaxID=124225 RepID=UPI00048CF907|nr:GatB/YqeY domain-containing protein [Brackiella oedipodis]